MKAIIDGIVLEGKPEEIVKYQQLYQEMKREKKQFNYHFNTNVMKPISNLDLAAKKLVEIIGSEKKKMGLSHI
jgi:hypothetical protein